MTDDQISRNAEDIARLKETIQSLGSKSEEAERLLTRLISDVIGQPDIDRPGHLYRLLNEAHKQLKEHVEKIGRHEDHLSGKGEQRGLLVRIVDLEGQLQMQSEERVDNRRWFRGLLAGIVLAIVSPYLQAFVDQPDTDRIERIENAIERLATDKDTGR